MKIKKILFIIFGIFSIIALSSCSMIFDFVDSIKNTSINQSTTKDLTTTVTTTPVTTTEVITTTPTTSSTSTSTSTQNSVTTTVTTTLNPEDLVTELDYGYGVDLLNYSNKEDLQELYLNIKNKFDEFYLSTSNITKEAVNVKYIEDGVEKTETEYYYFIGDIDYTKYNIESSMALMVVKNVLLDHPEYYFVDNSFITSSVKSGDVITSRVIKLSIDEDYALASDRIAYNNKIKNFKEDCFKDFTLETTKKEKVKSIHDYIIDHAEYAYDDFGNPSETSFAHNILGIIKDGKGVCESYSKLFTYLLKESEIPALTVSGNGYTSESDAGGAHAWNYVYIDSSYYGFDVTWNDTANTNHYYGLSSTELTNRYYDNVFSKYRFINPLYGAHAYTVSNSENGINYLYHLPELSNIGLI